MRALLLVLLVACKSTHLSGDDYNRFCTLDVDCVAVEVGDICECCPERTGINRGSLEAYEDDRAECLDECLMACPSVEAFCNQSTCDVRPATQ